MYNHNKSNDGFFTGVSLFFKLWFTFIVCCGLAIWALVIYAGYTAISNPAAVGQFAGEIVSGFNEKVK